MYNEKIVDINTGEEIIRPFTPEEIAEIEENKKIGLEDKKQADERKAIRESALSKLIDLGLTEEEIASL